MSLAGALLWKSEASELRLRWIHSVEKSVWEEIWRRDGADLVLYKARIEGSGAGMEPPPEARREGRFWAWFPKERLAEVVFAQSGVAGNWQICSQTEGCFQPCIAFQMRVCL